jgi:hypothetical protein
MTKAQMLDAIENAKKIHLQEMQKIRTVLDGKKIDNPTALAKTECACGMWFYTHESQMKEILGAQLFERLDKYHENWHKEYLNIYNIFFKEEKKKTGFFAKILKSDKIDTLLLDKAKLYFIDLQKSTDALLLVSEAVTRRISALNDTKFK